MGGAPWGESQGQLQPAAAAGAREEGGISRTGVKSARLSPKPRAWEQLGCKPGGQAEEGAWAVGVGGAECAEQGQAGV